MKPLVYLWTGNGYGKSTSAFGTALRAVGHKLKVIVIQFMKGRKDIGEYKIMPKLKPYYSLYQFGTPRFINLKKPSKKDIACARAGLDFVKEAIKLKPHLLVLDEVNLAAAIGLVSKNEVLHIIDTASPKTNVYLTGRFAPREFIDRADFVNVIECKKRKFVRARKGIEY